MADFSFERKIHRQGYRVVAGVDEVGRGCFAGPVVTGAAVFDQKLVNPPVINDSKLLSKKQRIIADKWIRENAKAYGIGTASVSQINRFGIKKATEIAFRKAIKNCGAEINYLLIDAFYIPYVKGLRRRNQKAIIHGDTKSISIAAASIVAKVYRDKLMTDLSKKPGYRKYKWDKNKGYGTKVHRNIILKYGTTNLHRKQFVETWLGKA